MRAGVDCARLPYLQPPKPRPKPAKRLKRWPRRWMFWALQALTGYAGVKIELARLRALDPWFF